MPFTTFHTTKSTISEDCLWIKDGTRYICVSYLYFPSIGQIQYAASVLKSSSPLEDISDEQINGHEHTTIRRFKIRPVQTNMGKYLSYDDMLKQIRCEMCRGLGCVGPRHPIPRTDDAESLSSVEMMSDSSDYDPLVLKHKVAPRTYGLRNIKCIKYNYIDKEHHGEGMPFTQRTIFICFKGISVNGDVLYGACIHHEGVASIEEYEESEIDEDAHYETAMMRLEKCPVQMSIPEEFWHQLKKDAKHREDVMYHIVDKIKCRIDGHLQIKEILY